MASELTRTLTTPATVITGAAPDDGRPAQLGTETVRRTPPSRLALVAVSGLLSALLLLASLLTGWSGRQLGDGLVPVLAVTALLVLVVAVPIIAVAVRTMRGNRGSRTTHRPAARSAREPVESTETARPVAPARGHRAAVLTDRADVIAACDTALANRDLVGGEVALVVLDVVGPHQVQDLLGPSGIEDVARQTVRRLRAWLPPQDRVARLGPSSFAVLVEGLGAEGAAPQMMRLTALLGEPMASGGQVLTVGFAVGTAESGADSTGTEMLLRAARAAAVDAAGHTSAASTTSREPQNPVAEPLDDVDRLAAELGSALRQGGVQAAFRPIVRLDDDTERTIAIQALPRWVRPNGQDVPPERLEALAVQIGMPDVLGRQLLDRGLDAVAAWYAAGFAVGRLTVPMSQEELSDPDLPARVATLLARREMPGSCLVVEVDAASVSDGTAVRPALTRLREQGVEVILTSVVTPQAALGLLNTLPLSGISLHRSLTAVLAEHPVPATATVATCHRLGLRTIAEHVATAGQLRAARNCGIDGAWGPAIAAPARARDVSARFSAARSTALRG